ncbi:unnamed protein product, partial [Gulo gulo]
RDCGNVESPEQLLEFSPGCRGLRSWATDNISKSQSNFQLVWERSCFDLLIMLLARDAHRSPWPGGKPAWTDGGKILFRGREEEEPED